MIVIRKIAISFGIVIMLSFISCGGGSSSEAKDTQSTDDSSNNCEDELDCAKNEIDENRISTSQNTIKKTGQTTSYEEFDDGYYQTGVTPSYSRKGEIVIDHITGLQWQDNEDPKRFEKKWEYANRYCSILSLGGKNDWRIPTHKELKSIVDYGKIDPAISLIFQNVTSKSYWSSTISIDDSNNSYYTINLGSGSNWRGDKINDKCDVCCVRK